jgi:hypothetical protein
MSVVFVLTVHPTSVAPPRAVTVPVSIQEPIGCNYFYTQLGATIFTYFENNKVNLSLLNVSNILFPDNPLNDVARVGISSFADFTSIMWKVTSMYLSFPSDINLNPTPFRFISSPKRQPIFVFTGSNVPCVVPNICVS